MGRYAGHTSGKSKTTWQASCDAVRDASMAADNTPPMSALALTIWAAIMGAGTNMFDVLSTPSLPGSGAFFETEMSVSDDPRFRSVTLTVTYRRP